MVHLALCAVVGLSASRSFKGRWGKSTASPRRRITLSYIYTSVFCIRLVFTSAPFRSGGPERRPTQSHSSHIVPSPQCLLLKVTQSKLGQSSQVKQKRHGPIAVETGLCSVCLPCLTTFPHRSTPTLSLPLACLSPPTNSHFALKPRQTHTNTTHQHPLPWLALATQRRSVPHKSAARPLGGVIER